MELKSQTLVVRAHHLQHLQLREGGDGVIVAVAVQGRGEVRDDTPGEGEGVKWEMGHLEVKWVIGHL